MSETLGGTGQQAAISRLIVQAMREYSGRGPTRASTTIGKNSVHCVLGDTLTQTERTLAEAGYTDEVLTSRRRLQAVMRAHLIVEVEKLLERKVIAFLGDNHISPDIAIESFVLEPLTEDGNDDVEPDQD